ncbi:MAG: hypothetical protein KDA95_01225 [Acidimicrobiales bacterium]|nr:hypothetical protein [Acidimicrobiales bacterium]
MRERVLAVVGALCLIALAIVVRGALSDKDESGPDSDSNSSGSDLPVVACTEDLMSICDQLAKDDHIAKDPPTLELGQDVPDGVNAWITWDPAPRIAGFAISQTNPRSVWTHVYGIAEAQLAAAGTSTSLQSACGPTTKWKCIAEFVADGSNPIGLGSPTTSEGLARLNPVATALIGEESDRALELRPAIKSPQNGQSDARTMSRELVTRPGAVSLVVGPVGLLRPDAESEGGKNRKIKVELPTPEAVANVVLATKTDNIDSEGLCKRLTQTHLEPLGLRAACGAPEIDETRAGFLFQIWKRFK